MTRCANGGVPAGSPGLPGDRVHLEQPPEKLKTAKLLPLPGTLAGSWKYF